MKIALDATDGFWPQATGTVVYARELVRHLFRLDLDGELVVLGLRTPGVDTSFAPGHALRLLRGPRSRAVWTQVRLPLHLLGNKYDLLHMPAPKFPAVCPCPSLVTVHDLAMFKFPEWFQPVQRKRLAFYMSQAVRRATHLVADSHSTKRDVIELFGRKDSEVDVVHLGADLATFRPGVEPARRAAPYILSVGTLQPRKNYVMLIRAFKRLCERWREPIELVLAGARGWLWEPIEAEARKPPFAERVQLLHYVSDEKLPGLYAGATLFVMPSLYEGFGIPLVEAMASGAPVITSNVSSLPEVVGDAGPLLDPSDIELWAETMRALLADAQRRKQMHERGLARALEFTWQRTAERTLAGYRKLLGKC
jgi:glycosyltransferase involved in cell wall biosynthesis